MAYKSNQFGNGRENGRFFQFERLDVWRMSVDWANEIMELSERIPKNYQYSLGEQLRRASLSVPTNIAEGTGRQGVKEKNHFYNIAKASVYEVISLLVMCGKRKIITREEYKVLYDQAHHIASMLTGLLRAKAVTSRADAS